MARLTVLWYDSPIYSAYYHLRYALANKGYVRHLDYTCPDNDICEGRYRH